jgi:hypothetical protein
MLANYRREKRENEKSNTYYDFNADNRLLTAGNRGNS